MWIYDTKGLLVNLDRVRYIEIVGHHTNGRLEQPVESYRVVAVANRKNRYRLAEADTKEVADRIVDDLRVEFNTDDSKMGDILNA